MRSMTGHGRGTAEGQGRRATVELRAVNHRFFDLKLRGAASGPEVEERVSQAIRKRAERGAFHVTLVEEGAGVHKVRVNSAMVRSAAAALEEVRAQMGSSEPVSLALVAAQPGVLEVGTEDSIDVRWEVLEPAIGRAMDELIVMRKREGAALADDLSVRLTRIEQLATEGADLAASAPEEWRKRLTERVKKLLPSAQASLDVSRLANEVALLADRLDVTEELVRLRSHLQQARALLKEDAPVGRRLEFLVQELGREVNTIGSKSQLADIANRIVESKAELERIREQVQNVE